jgi:hypothetical protein
MQNSGNVVLQFWAAKSYPAQERTESASTEDATVERRLQIFCTSLGLAG